jgi:hypothetical protein
MYFSIYFRGVGNFKSVHPCCWSSGSSEGWGQGRAGLLPPAFSTGLLPETSAAQRRHLAQADQVTAWRPPSRSQTNRAAWFVALPRLGQGLAIAAFIAAAGSWTCGPQSSPRSAFTCSHVNHVSQWPRPSPAGATVSAQAACSSCSRSSSRRIVRERLFIHCIVVRPPPALEPAQTRL